MFYIQFLKKFYWKNEQIAHFLFFGERCEWIAQVAHQKWAMWANRSGRSPKMSDPEQFTQVAQSTVNERLWGNRSGCSPKMSKWVNHSFFWANFSFAHLLIFRQKTSDSLGNPMSKFPALPKKRRPPHFSHLAILFVYASSGAWRCHVCCRARRNYYG